MLYQIQAGELSGSGSKVFHKDIFFVQTRKYLIDLLEDKSIPTNVQELAFKVFILLANVRASGEDLLIVTNLIGKHQFNFNVEQEIARFK